MKFRLSFFFVLSFWMSNSQTINLNESDISEYLRTSQLLGKFKNDISFTIRPIDISKNGIVIEDTIFNVKKYAPTLYTFLDGKGKIKLIPIDYNIEINTRHPYNRNNGSMIPNRGYQHIISGGIFAEIGPLSIQIRF